MRFFEKIEALGHENITARNKTTFEITKENHLTSRGDCIIAVNASKGAQDLSFKFKRLARRKDARITTIIEVGIYREISVGRGDSQLTLNHKTDLVARKSDYKCDRTFMICADTAAADFSRELVKELQKSKHRIVITLVVDI